MCQAKVEQETKQTVAGINGEPLIDIIGNKQ